MKRVSIMQPYIFPYIGYVQMINAVDTFVFYDDVNFIKQGWINRNRILVNGKDYLFTVPVEDISSFRQIRDVAVHGRNYIIWRDKFLKTVSQSYAKAPFFQPAFEIVRDTFAADSGSIADFARRSCLAVASYLSITTTFLDSSTSFSESKGLDKADRLIAICKKLGATDYINPIGGTELYEKSYFLSHGINLSFIRMKPDISYRQGKLPDFIPGLSIIDVMMYNSKETIQEYLQEYTLQ